MFSLSLTTNIFCLWLNNSVQNWLVVGERPVAFGADAHRILEAVHGQDTAVGRAVVANGATAQTAMVLSQAELPLVKHGAQVPEKGPAAALARARFGPLGGFQPLDSHAPQPQHRVLTGRHQFTARRRVAHWRHLVPTGSQNHIFSYSKIILFIKPRTQLIDKQILPTI